MQDDEALEKEARRQRHAVSGISTQTHKPSSCVSDFTTVYSSMQPSRILHSHWRRRCSTRMLKKKPTRAKKQRKSQRNAPHKRRNSSATRPDPVFFHHAEGGAHEYQSVLKTKNRTSTSDSFFTINLITAHLARISGVYHNPMTRTCLKMKDSSFVSLDSTNQRGQRERSVQTRSSGKATNAGRSSSQSRFMKMCRNR